MGCGGGGLGSGRGVMTAAGAGAIVDGASAGTGAEFAIAVSITVGAIGTAVRFDVGTLPVGEAPAGGVVDSSLRPCFSITPPAIAKPRSMISTTTISPHRRGGATGIDIDAATGGNVGPGAGGTGDTARRGGAGCRTVAISAGWIAGVTWDTGVSARANT